MRLRQTFFDWTKNSLKKICVFVHDFFLLLLMLQRKKNIKHRVTQKKS
jgi:hypothetical protein